jgi:hypothetical protein
VMIWLFLLIALFPFGVGAVFGAPYVPLLPSLRDPILDLAGIQPGQTLVDLGSGDGSLLLAAAQRGVRCIGYEINPILWLISMYSTRHYRHLVTIQLRNYWRCPLPSADVIFIFLIARHMTRLDAKLRTELTHPTTVISMTFAIPDRRPDQERPFAYRYRYGEPD